MQLRQKIALMSGIAVLTSVWWARLVWSAIANGYSHSQPVWFNMHHSNLTLQWVKDPYAGTLILLGAFFAFYLWDYWGNSRLALFYVSGLIIIMLDRLLNLGSLSIQSRKFLEFTHVFALQPLAIGLISIWDRLAHRPEFRRAMVALGMLAFLAATNGHTEMYQSSRYKIGINQRIPKADLDVFRAVETHDRVFLTNKYIECCYFPYYQFVTLSNVSAHLAGQFEERITFLEAASKIDDDVLLAYAFRYNRFDTIDYVYLPRTADGMFELKVNKVGFLSSFSDNVEYRTIQYQISLIDNSEAFLKRHARGMYQVLAPSRSDSLDQILLQRYSAASAYLRQQ